MFSVIGQKGVKWWRNVNLAPLEARGAAEQSEAEGIKIKSPPSATHPPPLASRGG